VFHELGLVEHWGSGIQRMLATFRDSGLAPPVWEEIGIRVRVTLWTGKVGTVEVNRTDREILDLLADSEGHRTRAIAEAIGLTTRATRTRLVQLVARGLVREIGTGPTDPGRRYLKAGN